MSFWSRFWKRLRPRPLEVELASDLLDLPEREKLVSKISLSSSLEKNIGLVQEALGSSMDLNQVRFLCGPEKVPAAIFYLDGMVNNRSVEELLRALKIDSGDTNPGAAGRGAIFNGSPPV